LDVKVERGKVTGAAMYNLTSSVLKAGINSPDCSVHFPLTFDVVCI
jgi:hypothetical protein